MATAVSPTPSLSPAGSLALLAVATLTIMVGSAIVPALPSIAAHHGLERGASWLVTLPALGVVVFSPLAGHLIDHHGARAALLAGLGLYGLLGLLGAVLTPTGLLLADRFLLGAATALVMAAGTGLISAFFEGAARLRMIARQGMAIELGGVVFLTIGGSLASLGWRWPFLLYGLAWVFLAAVLWRVPRPATAPTHRQANTPERRGRYADILLAAFGSLLVFFIAVITLPVAMARQGHSEAVTGYYLALVSLVAVAAASVMPAVVRQIGTRYTLLLAFALYALAHLLLAGGPATLGLIVAALPLGSGFGLSIPLANHAIVERSPAARRGRNLATLSMAVFLGQVASSLVDATVSAPEQGFVVAAVLALTIATGYAALSRPAQRAPAV